jgi:hypothetical protein
MEGQKNIYQFTTALKWSYIVKSIDIYELYKL